LLGFAKITGRSYEEMIEWIYGMKPCEHERMHGKEIVDDI
jgi:hypothetical protein